MGSYKMEEKPKYKPPRCEHDKIKSQCKECGEEVFVYIKDISQHV